MSEKYTDQDGNEWTSIQISLSDIERCPLISLYPGHYNEDGSCKCEPEEKETDETSHETD